MINLNLNPIAVLDLQPGDRISFQGQVFIVETGKFSNREQMYFTSEDSRTAEYNRLAQEARQNDDMSSYPEYKKYITHIRVCLEDRSASDHNTAVLTRQGWYGRLLNNECVID